MMLCEQVSFAYAAPLVSAVDLSVGAGELCAIVGPNGAGKSTLVRLLLGLLAPSSGRVTVDGRDVASMRPRERARLVAAVLQDEPCDFPFSALDVVLVGRYARLGPVGFAGPEDVAAAERAMRATGVWDFADRAMTELSGGERKRVLLARALAQGTEALVLDEPAAALDLANQLELFSLLEARRKEGAAIAVVVHDLNLAAAFATKVALVRAGQAAVVGTVEEVLTEARVQEAFGVEVALGRHPRSGARVLFPIRR